MYTHTVLACFCLHTNCVNYAIRFVKLFSETESFVNRMYLFIFLQNFKQTLSEDANVVDFGRRPGKTIWSYHFGNVWYRWFTNENKRFTFVKCAKEKKQYTHLVIFLSLAHIREQQHLFEAVLVCVECAICSPMFLFFFCHFEGKQIKFLTFGIKSKRQWKRYLISLSVR